ncbi:MAG: hypothetical protein JXD19_08905 [Deltaproteobacteria bacterium]|nr:hypothetical protein [Deltaproteobacteria bacterium]
MPLEFQSLSHGPIAFGFFNIDTDMLLLEHYFLFAPEFCEYISALAGIETGAPFEDTWRVYPVESRMDIGNLMGAIHGIAYQGFIGEVYKRFPFPQQPEEFRQKPDGFKNRETVDAIIRKYATMSDIPLVVDQDRRKVEIGDYTFSRDSFRQLLKYVWRGGYPRWKEGKRPDCVLHMKSVVEKSEDPLFKGIMFTDDIYA